MEITQCLRAEKDTYRSVDRLIEQGQAMRLRHVERMRNNNTIKDVFRSSCRLWGSFYEPIIEECAKSDLVEEHTLRVTIEHVLEQGSELFFDYIKRISSCSDEDETKDIVLMDLFLKIGDLLSLKYSIQTVDSNMTISMRDILNCYLNTENSTSSSPRTLAYEKIAKLLLVQPGNPTFLASIYFALLSIEMIDLANEISDELRKVMKKKVGEFLSCSIQNSGALTDSDNYIGIQKESFFFAKKFDENIAKPMPQGGLIGLIHIFLRDLYSCHETSSVAITADVTRAFSDCMMKAMESHDDNEELEKSIFMIASILSKTMRGKGDIFHQYMALSDFCEPVMRACLSLAVNNRSSLSLAAFAVMLDLCVDIEQTDKVLTRDLLEVSNTFSIEEKGTFKIQTLLGSKAVCNVICDSMHFDQHLLESHCGRMIRKLKFDSTEDGYTEPVYRLLIAVIDTNAVLYDRYQVEEAMRLMEFKCVIPNVVVSELENLAKPGKPTYCEAKAALEWIYDHKQKSNLKICNDHKHSRMLSRINDESILDCARLTEKKYQYLYRQTQTSLLVSNDLNLRNKARADDVAALKPGSLLAYMNSLIRRR
ncbi:hypothetical protein ACOME3_003618 [Neoechinorhynchus agilis]